MALDNQLDCSRINVERFSFLFYYENSQIFSNDKNLFHCDKPDLQTETQSFKAKNENPILGLRKSKTLET